MDIESTVKEMYGSLARKNTSCCEEGSPNSTTNVVQSFGCAVNFMEQIALQEGEVVLDLGSGLGNDSFTAAEHVGEQGKVYGIDFTEDMIRGAKENAKKLGISNVFFLKGNVKNIPLEDGVADVVISNCVFNLIDSKEKAFEEAFRILKKGGRIVISDMISELKESEEGQLTQSDYCACIGGATSIEEYNNALRNAGFDAIKNIEQYKSEYKADLIKVPYTSVLFMAIKP